MADPRQARGVRHTIGAVLAVMVLAVLAGARSFREIADRAADLPPELLVLARCRVNRLTGRYMVPSAATMRRVAHDVDADAIDERVCAWLRAEAMATAIAAGAAGEAPGRLVAVAVDGKTIRNTCQPGSEASEIKLFSALLHQEAIVIAQVRIPDGTNEITQIPALLAGVNLTDVVVTGDAAHAQQTTAAYLAIERAGHYALTVKGNQPGLLAQIAAALPAAVPGSEHHVTDDRSKGKIVRRAIWVAPAESIDFPGVLPRPDLDPKVKLPAPKLEENPQHRKWPDWFWTQLPSRPPNPTFLHELSAWLNQTIGTHSISKVAARIAGALGFNKADVERILDEAFRSGGEDAFKALLEKLFKKLKTPSPQTPGGANPTPFPSTDVDGPAVRF